MKPCNTLSLDISPLASECWLQVTYSLISLYYVIIYNIYDSSSIYTPYAIYRSSQAADLVGCSETS